ncbi:MAG TPA: PadR family transcriptional regulator [Steroidobacteraceae bacterium]|nr:PadR family transcriptional regulator [Steroidobacteraceae bacterium]
MFRNRHCGHYRGDDPYCGPVRRGRRGERGRSDESYADRSHFYGRGGGFGRGGGGGGRIFGPGDLRLILLALVAEKPSHGYDLIKAVEQKFGGGYSPSPGSVYPTLTLLEDLGHIRASISEGSRRLFEVTDEGRAFLAGNQTVIDGIMARVALAARAMSGSIPPPQIHQAMHTLRAALLLHRGEWTEAEADRVREILELAAEAISKKPSRE